MDYWRPHNGQQIIHDADGKRGLIKEYFARTRTTQEPPAIFRSNNGSQFPAYFAAATTTAPTIPDDDMDLEQVLNFVDENFKEICVSSVIVPETKRPKTPTYYATPATVRRNSDNCHLIGRVNPNILRTWQQLNLYQNGDRQGDDEVIKNSDEDPASFKVNYVTYDQSAAEDLFYDSIDEGEEEDRNSSEVSRSNAATFELSSGTAGAESIIFRGLVGKDAQSSLMTDSAEQYLTESPLTAGEGMAEFDSLDKKRLKCWSLDNEVEY